MKALLLEVNRSNWAQTKGYRLGDVAPPALHEDSDKLDAHSAILEPIFGGVCGTDKGIWYRKAFKEAILSTLEQDKADRRVAGHEMLGRIVELGSEAKRQGKFSVGQVVTAESHLYCGKCPMCLAGDEHVCINERIIGVTWDGVFAERVKLPTKVLRPIDLTKIRPEVAAIQEPFGNAVHVCTPFMAEDGAEAFRGKTVAVFGCGTIGLFAIMIAKAFGAAKIIGVEPNPANQEKAKICGADKVIAPSDHSAEEITKFCDGLGANFCLEMSGFSSSVLQAIRASRRGGHIVLFGLAAGDLVIPQFEEFITAGKRIHAIVGRRVHETWKLSKELLEDKSNGIQDKIWKVILNEGQGTILPLSEFTPEKFEAQMSHHPKTLVQIGKV